MCLKNIESNLKSIAYKKSIPFCYSCYKEAPSGVCKTCHSDDLMRLIPGVGCEYGTEWVVEELLKEDLEAVDTEEIFEQMIEECYEETTKVGFMEFSTVELMKNNDPIYWSMAQSEYVDGLAQDEQLISFDNGSNYYWIHDLESYIEENLEEAV